MNTWAQELQLQYESDAVAQFILHGNVDDRHLLPLAAGAELGSLTDFLLKVLLPRFDVVITYDVGNGLRVERGGEALKNWPRFQEKPDLPREPRAAVDWLSHFMRWCVNVARLGQRRWQVAVIVRSADLLLPAGAGWAGHELSGLASQVRDWAADAQLAEHSLATILIAPNLNDLHPLVAMNPRAARIKLPLPDANGMAAALTLLATKQTQAFGTGAVTPTQAAPVLAGASLSAVEALVKVRHHEKKPLADNDLAALKKQLVEQDTGGLIDFIQPTRTLDDLHGQTALKTWLRQDLALWRQGESQAMPMGYLMCGPVGTGKTYMVECLAGEAGVPVVKLKNFRDKWVGSTEGNLEKIFRLVHALGRCYVFIDEADQALGRRSGGGDDSGIGGRVYGMMAEEMSRGANRGKIVWILASSRPDLIEVDLKRPGRVDVKIPLFPTATPAEGWGLMRALLKRRGVTLPDAPPEALAAQVPDWLTPGAAEALAVRIFRQVKTGTPDALAATAACLADYRHPVPRPTLEAQVRLAVAESSDAAFVPESFRGYGA